MAVASLVLGVVAIIISIIPIIRIIAFFPAVLSIIFAIVELASKKKNKRKSDSIVGMSLSFIALIIIIIRIMISIFFILITGSNLFEMMFEEFEDYHPYIYEEHYRDRIDNDINEFDIFMHKDLI